MSKNVWISLAVIIVAGLVLWMVLKNDTPEVDSELEEQVVSVTEEEVEGTEDVSEGSVNATAPSSALTYQAALAKYANARLQLNNSCQVSPNNVTYKNGASVMLDNRSAATRTVKLGSTYTIKPYGFKIVQLSSSTLPSTLLMDCDGSQNVATVLIQK